MIIRAKHNFLIYGFFRLYTLVQIKRFFHRVYFHGEFSDRGLPVVIIANHISWWDGFWAMYLNIKLLHRKFHFMMLEEQLRKNWFFMYTGGFSVRKGTKSVIETIKHAKEIIEKKENVLLVFPQGKIESLYKTSFNFERGIERIIEGKQGKIHFLLNANFIEFASQKKPSLYIFYREAEPFDFSLPAICDIYNDFYRACRETLISGRGQIL